MMRTIAPILFGFLFCISSNAATVLVIAEGDSITAGNGTTGGSNWVNQLGYFINDIKVTCTNIALSGDTISNNIALVGLTGLDTSGTNVQWATRFYTNTSGSTKTITVPAAWVDIGSLGTTLYNTNQGVLSLVVYPGFGTNFVWRGK